MDQESQWYEVFSSFDVKNLYGNIPRSDSPTAPGMFTVLEEFFTVNAQLDNILQPLDTHDFIKIMKLALGSDFIIFDGDTYQQIDGLSMGNPLAPQVAIIYMDKVERIILSSIPETTYWKRYIDDIFITWNHQTTAAELLQIANNVNDRIQFTLEEPNNEGRLPFLDCEITLNDGIFQSRLYIKDIHSGAICHWDSRCPISTKLAIMKGELTRADRRSTNFQNKQYSEDIVLQRLRNNGYPTKFRNMKKKSQPETNPTQKFIYVKCPFMDERMKRKCQATIRRNNLQNKVRLYFDSGKPLRRIFHPPKERQQCRDDCISCQTAKKDNLCNTKHAIYRIECLICGHIYIGESKRILSQRIVEHLSGRQFSAVQEHFKNSHPGHKMKVEWDILHRNLPIDSKRRCIESHYINSIPPDKLINNITG